MPCLIYQNNSLFHNYNMARHFLQFYFQVCPWPHCSPKEMKAQDLHRKQLTGNRSIPFAWNFPELHSQSVYRLRIPQDPQFFLAVRIHRPCRDMAPQLLSSTSVLSVIRCALEAWVSLLIMWRAQPAERTSLCMILLSHIFQNKPKHTSCLKTAMLQLPPGHRLRDTSWPELIQSRVRQQLLQKRGMPVRQRFCSSLIHGRSERNKALWGSGLGRFW